MRFQGRPHSSIPIAIICFREQIPDIRCCHGLLQEVAEVLTSKVARNVFQATEVIARAVRRRNQQEQNEHVFSVEAREVDAISGDRNRRRQFLDRCVFCVWDCDAITNAGRSQLLRFQ